MKYRLGLDLGSTSIGWCLLGMDKKGRPKDVGDIGVRIFSDGRDPQSGTSLAVDRRTARSMRRRRDRYLLRRKDLMKALIAHGLMPKDEAKRKALETLDPYEIRARGFDEKLALHELGRALFHLNQRRGFRSNRKVDAADDSESGKIKSGGQKLDQMMAKEKSRTIGEFLYRRHKDRHPVRARLSGEGAKAEYDFYPQRAMLEDEFRILWDAQARHHKELTEKKRDALFTVIFRQRPLKPVKPGKCALDPARDNGDEGGMRAPWALPLAQRFRIYQELANLKIVSRDRSERPLSIEERDLVAAELFKKTKMTFKAMRKKLKTGADERLNMESEKRDHLKGDEVAVKLSKKDLFGERWHELTDDEQAEIAEKMLTEEDAEALAQWLSENWDLGQEAAEAVTNARLPEGYCRLGRRALVKIVPIMRDQGLGYADAANEAGYHHSDRRDDIFDSLPYYGEALERHVSGSGDPDDPVETRLGRIAKSRANRNLNGRQHNYEPSLADRKSRANRNWKKLRPLVPVV